MSTNINLQIQVKESQLPSEQEINTWVAVCLEPKYADSELSIRITDVTEITRLNQMYRHQNTPTNVLSFANEPIPTEQTNYLGDIAICATIVKKEAEQQGKLLKAHWAHLVIHGVLHLLGYDHIQKKDAQIMEPLEIRLMQQLGFDNPYAACIPREKK